MSDILTLGGIVFTNFSPPQRMPAGGRQAMAIHKLIGGSRVIDTLGPDDRDIAWEGVIFDNAALSIAHSIDALRSAGAPVALTWGAESATVVISEFNWEMVRWPVFITYQATCVVSLNGALGNLAAAAVGTDALVGADLNAANAAATSPPSVTTPQLTQNTGLGLSGAFTNATSGGTP